MRKYYISLFYMIAILQNATSQDAIINHVSNHYQNHFGWSISGDNDYIAVSDPRDSIHYYSNGCVNIYKKNGTNWDYLQTLQNENVQPFDYFGHRVSMDNNYLAISSIGDRMMGFMSGAVHIFQLDNGKWKVLETLRQSSVEEKTQFGESLCFNGQYLFIGAPGLKNQGAVLVYALSGNTFSLLQQIDNPYPLRMQFGKSIAVSGDLLFVGAPSANMAMYKGSVFIFKRKNALWELNDGQSELLPGNEDYGALFGFSVSAEKDKLLIGAPHANVPDGNNEEFFFAGKAYYYQNVSGSWVKQKEFFNPDLASHDLFGSGVIVSDSIFYMSSPEDDVNEMDEGSFYLYSYNNNQWIQKVVNSPEKRKHNYFSNSFFVFDKHLFIGLAGAKQEKNKGRIFTYDTGMLLNLNKMGAGSSKEVIDIYPNPADKIVKVSISNQNPYTIKICSTDGKPHILKNLAGIQDIDVSNLPNGYYVVSINIKNQTYTQELVILHLAHTN